VPTLTKDIQESWHLFLLGVTRERGKTSEGKAWEQFGIKWDFVNAYLNHAYTSDATQTLLDLVDLERAMNT
jgi:hypothetical protein